MSDDHDIFDVMTDEDGRNFFVDGEGERHFLASESDLEEFAQEYAHLDPEHRLEELYRLRDEAQGDWTRDQRMGFANAVLEAREDLNASEMPPAYRDFLKGLERED